MTFDYADLAATAVELLADFGMAMTLARPTDIPATYDTATGVATPVGPDTYTVTGIKLDYSVREIDRENVQAGDQRVYLSTDGAVPPKPGDTLRIGSDVFRVMRAGNLSPAGVDLLYDVQVRR